MVQRGEGSRRAFCRLPYRREVLACAKIPIIAGTCYSDATQGLRAIIQGSAEEITVSFVRDVCHGRCGSSGEEIGFDNQAALQVW
jgi:hypothetical protein